MKLEISNNRINEHPEQFLRRAGYGFIRDRQRGKESFVRRLGSGHYPRLHMYVKQIKDNIIFDLHIDQKQTSYAGQHMHNAEYDGPVVEKEMNRLRSLLGLKEDEKQSRIQNRTELPDDKHYVRTKNLKQNDVFKEIEKRDYKDVIKEFSVKKKPWWKLW